MTKPCSIRDIQAVLDGPDTRVLACAVLLNLETDEYERYAVVSDGGGREVSVGGEPVFLLNPNAPLAQHLLDCRLGDIFLCCQVVSIDGSPILSDARRESLYREIKKQEDYERAVIETGLIASIH